MLSILYLKAGKSRQDLTKRGSATLEAAILAPLCVLIFSAVFDFGRWIHTEILVSRIVYEAARFASVQTGLEDPLNGSDALIVLRIEKLLSLNGFDPSKKLVDLQNTISGGTNTVSIKLTVPFSPSLPFPALQSASYRAEAPYLYPKKVNNA